MSDGFEAPCGRCVEREVATRLQRARALTLSMALERILRVDTLDRAQDLAADALRAEIICAHAMDGVRMPPLVRRDQTCPD